MTPLLERDILAHQHNVPWGQFRQVEQDLQLCRAIHAIFSDKFLSSQVAMRGGTLLHKVHLAPPARYSEDIDLVLFGDRSADHVQKGLVRVLEPVLGRPSLSLEESVRLTIRNTFRPSRLLRLSYKVPTVIEPGAALSIKVEVNVDERKSHRPIVVLPFSVPYRGGKLEASLNGYELHEMLGTKMRALFQRKAGRDLFDLYWALSQHVEVDPAEVIASFSFYLLREGSVPGRQAFVDGLHERLLDRSFCTDMTQMLRKGLSYDPQVAGNYIEARLLSLLPP